MQEEDKHMLLRVEHPFPTGVLLCDFESDLTFFHGTITCADTEWFEKLFGVLVRHAIGPATRLHKDHVLLLRSPAHNSDIVASFQDWLQKQGFSTGLLQFFCTRSEYPIEDGFFTCVSAVAGSVGARSDLEATGTLKWQEFATDSDAIGHVLADFIAEEEQRHGGHDLMQFLDELYSARDRPRLFDMESAYLEFAASIWSANELRFWSRPVQYPK